MCHYSIFVYRYSYNIVNQMLTENKKFLLLREMMQLGAAQSSQMHVPISAAGTVTYCM